MKILTMKMIRTGWGLAIGLGCMMCAGAAFADELAAGETRRPMPLTEIFTLLFIMLGPIKIIAPFMRLTRGADPKLRSQIALQATLLSSVALLLAALIGEAFLAKYGIPLPVLALAGGIIFFLVALQNILQQFSPPEESKEEIAPPSLKVAMSPLAFPTIVTPYGIAALIVFLALEENLERKLIIGALALGIMLLNLVVMLSTHSIPRSVGLLLKVLGAVLGIIQVALGLQIILNSIRFAMATP